MTTKHKKTEYKGTYPPYPYHIKTNDGYDAYLVDIQPLPEGQQSPIYRFPGGDRVVDPHDIKNGVVRIIEW